MKKFTITFLAFALLTAGTASAAETKPAISVSDAIVWMQTSAEYRALCYQAYNTALERVKSAAGNFKSGDKPIAIILDCDETVVDNTPFFAALFSMDLEGESSASIFMMLADWINSGEVTAMPGAANFLNAVDKLGAAIFYVTNKPAIMKEATLISMKAMKFPQVDDAHVLLDDGQSDKEYRFRKIEEDYNVVVYLGDSAHDFPIGMYGKNMNQRNAIADVNRELFGQTYILLPNPIYGSWMSLMGGASSYGNDGMTPEERQKALTEALRIWKGSEGYGEEE